MEAERSRVRWTWAEYARLPESGSTRYEVIDDELVVTPAPTPQHQRIVGRLILTLGLFVKDHDLGEIFPGPCDVLFAEGDYFEPDILFVAGRDRGIKLDRYRLFGVPEYWIVDPDERRIEVWDLASGAREAAIHDEGDVLTWKPAGAEVSLEVPVAEIAG